jgi:hypothetical protein
MKTGKGELQGYQEDFTVIDLQEFKIFLLYRLTFTRLRSWILMPAAVYTSVDNVNYKIVDSPFLHLLIQKMIQPYFTFTINQKSIKSEICKSVC